MTRDLVSIGIPLYRSARFFDVIAGNIRSVDYPNLEFIVSDRHLADDTIDRLAGLFAGDRRVRFLKARDELDWIAHHNLLLKQARGRYFCWFSHDDAFSPDWVRASVACLERDPAVAIAFGRVEPLLEAGHPGPEPRWIAPPPCAEPPRSIRAARALFDQGNLAMGFHGVFRRRDIVDRDLWIRRTHGGVAADYLWMFALALVGRLQQVPQAVSRKLYYPRSTHARMTMTTRGDLSGVLAMSAYIRRVRGLGPGSAPPLWAAAAWAAKRIRRRERLRVEHAGRLVLHVVRRGFELGPRRSLARLRGSERGD